jgi:carboxypeptidase C (cathepsin A)
VATLWRLVLLSDTDGGYQRATDEANDFTFLTVRMAGHMVPNTQPATALTFFNHFLHNASRF